jgi:glucosamine kinase
MAYFLGVDAGGTKTDYVLADEGGQIASVRTGSIKRLRVSDAVAEHHLLTALDALREQSGVDLSHVNVTCVGAAGANVPLVQDWLRHAFDRHVGGTLILVEDVEIALDAAFFGKGGILILAGTGSNVAGRDVDGHLTTAGGWGPALADHGSGYRLGAAALEECFLALDEGQPTVLLDEILAFWQLPDIAALVEKVNCQPRPDFSQLAALVARSAEKEDASASRVILRESASLAHLAGIVIDRLRCREGEQRSTTQVAFTGSIMQHVLPMRRTVERLLMEAHPDVQILPGVAVPSEGALWRARQSYAPLLQ